FVMLDMMQPRTDASAGECPLQLLHHARARTLVADAIDDERDLRARRDEKRELAAEVRRGILVHGDVVHVGERYAGLAQAISDRLAREAGPVLHPPEAFLFRGRQELAVSEHARRGIAMVGVQAEHDHAVGLTPWTRYWRVRKSRSNPSVRRFGRYPRLPGCVPTPRTALTANPASRTSSTAVSRVKNRKWV